MDFKKLIYKQNDVDNTMRISKTKVITIIVFIIFFAWSFPDFLNNGLLSALFSAILVGLTLAIPTFVVGWIIGKLLNKNQVVKKNVQTPKNTTHKKKDNNSEINNVKTPKTTTRKSWTFDTPQEYEYKLRYLASNGMMEEADNLWQEAVEHYPENKMSYTAIVAVSAKKKVESYDFGASIDNKMKAIDKITDDKELQDIAEREQVREVRLQAISKIQDNSILAELVTSDFGGEGPYKSFGPYANYVIELITDNEILRDIYMKSFTCLSSLGLKNVSNKDVLIDIANNATLQCHKNFAQDILNDMS